MGIWKQLVGALLRHLLSMLIGVLIAKGIIDEELGDKVVESAVFWLTLAVLFLCSFGWSMAQKWINKKWFEAAKEAPANASMKEIGRRASEKIKEALPIVAPEKTK